MTQRNSNQQPEWVSLATAAERLDMSSKTLRRMIAAGALPASRVGNWAIRVRVSDLDALMTPIGGAA